MSKARRRGLGRGIGEIFGATAGGAAPGEIPIDSLQPGPWQPRQKLGDAALRELAQTIAERGVLQPILARQGPKGYQIVAGERRWRAARMAGLRTVPVVVREFSDRDALLAALVENIQRQDLNALEQAQAARRVVDELKLSVKDAAAQLGMSRPALSNLLRLLELRPEVRKLLAEDAISAGHARAIAALPKARQAQAARAAVRHGLTVRQLEQLASGKPQAAGKKKAAVDADTARLAAQLSEKLGMAVQISGRGGKGRVVISYRSLDSLDALVAKLKK